MGWRRVVARAVSVAAVVVGVAACSDTTPAAPQPVHPIVGVYDVTVALGALIDLHGHCPEGVASLYCAQVLDSTPRVQHGTLEILNASTLRGAATLQVKLALADDVYVDFSPSELSANDSLTLKLAAGTVFNAATFYGRWTSAAGIAATGWIGNPPYAFREGTLTATRVK